MKAFILYNPNSEHASSAESYVRDFQSRRDPRQSIELLNTETRQGGDMAVLYDVVRYPAIVVARETGELVKLWQGMEEFPLMDELAGYLTS